MKRMSAFLACAGAAALVLVTPWTQAAADDSAAPVAPHAAAAISVEAITVERGPMRAWLTTEGTARAVRREILHFGRAGKVVEIGVEETGQMLREGSAVRGPRDGRPGQLIAGIDERQMQQRLLMQSAQGRAAVQRVEQAQAALNAARATLGSANNTLERVRKLAESGVVPRKQLQDATDQRTEADAQVRSAQAQLEAARAEAEAASAQTSDARLQMEDSQVRAPFDGLIAFLNVAEGDYVQPLGGGAMSEEALLRTAAAVVVDPTEFEVVAEVPSMRGLMLRRGLPAEITWAGLRIFEAYDAARASGDPAADGMPVAQAEVYAVAPAIAPDSRAIRVRLRTSDGATHLRDGLYVAVRIEAGRKDDALVVPVKALRYDAGQPFVYVVDDAKGTAHRQPVKVGMSDGERIEVTDGLERGATVITSGQERLLEGAPVTILSAGG